MKRLIEKVKPSDAKEILELTKIFGAESDNSMVKIFDFFYGKSK